MPARCNKNPPRRDADPADSCRDVYWSAVNVDRQVERLQVEYTQMLGRLKLLCPKPRRR